MRLLRLLSLLALAACTGGPPDGVVDDCARTLALPAPVSTDVLFVIDDSQSMQEEQAKVVDRLGAFVAALSAGPVAHDFRLGVITTSVRQTARQCGDTTGTVEEFEEAAGRLQPGKDLEGRPLGDGRRLVAFDDPDLLPAAARLLGQGIAGAGQEMPLEAIRLALTEPLLGTPLDATPAGNAGFLRPGARLLVVIVSDEDDCSDPAGLVTVEPTCGGSCAADADCGGEGRYCLPDPLDPGARRCAENRCETPEGRTRLAPVDAYVDFLRGLDDGVGRPREVFVAAIAPVSADEARTPERCRSATDEAYGTGFRLRALVDAMGDHGSLASICEADYGAAFDRIAELVAAPQALTLAEAPPDGRLLRIVVTRAEGAEQVCRLGEGFAFEPAAGHAPARVILEEPCRLRNGDEVRIELVCAG